MATLEQRYGSWALVAGAAEGLGEGFTLQLAAGNMNLIMVDINKEALNNLADSVERLFGIATRRLHLDLSDNTASSQCMEEIEQTGCRVLIYVAAWSQVKRFSDLTHPELERFLSVNTRTPLHLIHAFSGYLISIKKPGGILLMSSLAGLIGPRFVAPYAATKAFVIRLAESLYDEFRVHGIDIMACCAGTTSTPAYWRSKPKLGKFHPKAMQPEDVARYAIKVLGKTPVCIPGWKNRVVYFLMLNIFPRRVARMMVNGAMEKMYAMDPDRVR